MQLFQKVIADDLEAVNHFIIDQLHSRVGLVENIGHYIVDAGGKRLRPILVLLVSNCLNAKQTQHISLAAIIEFIHTATLLHDDVVDISALRRGRPTANAKFGNAPSVLVGDFLYSRAFQLLVEIASLDIMRVMSDATNTIAEGEVQQLVNVRNAAIDEKTYYDVIWKKTAVLFEAACESAAALNGVDPTLQRACKQFGHHLGLAFQLIDDALDYTGDAQALGKNVGDDLQEGKVTLPLIYAMANASGGDKLTIETAIADSEKADLAQVIQIVQHTGAIQYTEQQAALEAEKAKAALQLLPDNTFRQAMLVLADFAVARNN